MAKTWPSLLLALVLVGGIQARSLTAYRDGDCSLNAYLTCDQYARCIDSQDGTMFTCECLNDVEGDGFKETLGGTGCKLPLKPCATGKDCPEYGTCSPEHSCVCDAGFHGDGFTCEDINECDDASLCDPNAHCVNEPGKFSCRCNQTNGYYGDGFTCNFKCASNNDCDAPIATCNDDNICICNKGYKGDGKKCTDVDECAPGGGHNCMVNANCVNTVGSFKCECKNGYTGDGINCASLPRNCKEVPSFVNGNKYKIDPDGPGPANAFNVICDKINGVIVTKLPPTGPFPMTTPKTNEPLVIMYEPSTTDIQPLLENSGFCYQDISFRCSEAVALFPGTKWYDAYDNAHSNWGSTEDEKCACGELKVCPASCYCDGTKPAIDAGRVLNKRNLPVVAIAFNAAVASKGSVDIQPLICSDVLVGFPKDCHDAKFHYNIKKNTPLHIDPDGPSQNSLPPFLVYCDMQTFTHVGVTDIIIENTKITTVSSLGTPVNYIQDLDKINALINGSVFCSQRVEFQCKNSRLFSGNGFISVTSDQRKLDYFPGAGGVQNSCGCGVTNSCQDPSVKCNCDIGDDQERKDFGLIIDKRDLPVVSVTAENGEGRSATYVIGNLQCSQIQFGIQPNCEKYRQGGQSEDYTYWADPGGPELENDLPPFLVECKFVSNPPQGITVIHHNSNDKTPLEPVRYFNYISASWAQIESLKNRSTLCTQEISVNCKQVNIQVSGGAIQFTSPNDTLKDLNKFLATCGTDGTSCNCDGLGDGSDRGILSDLASLPVKSLQFSNIIEQLHGTKELRVSVGPLVCEEIFPTCAELQAFLNSDKIAIGESKSVQSGLYTVDPDGLGGVEPMTVQCVLQATKVFITPAISSVTTDPQNPYKPVDKCFDVTYTDGMGNPISAAQITALVKKSNKCKQDLSLDCKNAPFTNNVNYTSCDGIHQRGWAGSFKSDKCACGVNGNCDGGPLASCNCDMNDNVVRSDIGSIINTDSLPVCQICFHIDPKPGVNGSSPPVSLLKYTLGELICDGGQGTKRTCQNARPEYGSILKSNLERSVASTDEEPSPYGCKFLPKPPIGILTVKAETPLITSNDTSNINITISYITINITLIRQSMQQNEYCTQTIFLFCASAETLRLGGQYGWYSYSGVVSYEWRPLPDASEEVKKICIDNPSLCTKCGNPKGFIITQQEKLPVTRLKLAGTGATVIIGNVECFDLKRSCQEILDTNSRSTGLVRGNVYVLDVDGSGPLKPFTANCELDDTNKNGVTEIPVTGNLTGSVHIAGKDGSTNFELPITYEGVTHEQIHGLALISDFCWQGLKYECRYSPIQRSNPASTYLNLYYGKEQSFGTGNNSSFPGCACAQTGTCPAGHSCKCDALDKPAVDQGFVTDTAKMPITSIGIGGQLKEFSGSADIRVTNVRCSSKPIDPPRDCDDAFKRRSKFGVTYSNNSEYLISPNPELNGVKPFIVYCDFKLSPGNGVTIIKPNLPPRTPLVHTIDAPNEFLYYGPSDDQILALIARSAYCYQGVRYDCYASTFLNEGNYWQSIGSNEKHQFWGGGEKSEDGRSGVCACGKDQTCGGLDSATAQRLRRCNCDTGDNTFRSDAGIIDIKQFLPVSKLQFSRFSKFQTVNLTLGDLMCSQTPLKFNECELGFSDCHPNADCVDEDNGYRCVCKPGWNSKYLPLTRENPRANGRECIDDDECAGNLCPYNANCTNTPGDFYCTCKPGYRQTGKTTCEDINECANSSLNNCDPHARCENLDGSFRCICEKDYRGDGVHCIPVGKCSCFGDPHCTSFDHRWLHFQGKCDYVMSQDGCQGVSEPTYKVVVKHWQKSNEKPGNYAWIKEVIINIFNLEIRLQQNNRILVNGSVVSQYFDEHRLSILMFNNRVKVQTVIGLEIVWDGKDAVELVVPQLSAGNKLCGLCGNFNNNATDDWEMGPGCHDLQGQQTDNPDLFGRSWTWLGDPTSTCAYDCEPNVPPLPECHYPNALYEKECDALFNMNTSPFKDCLMVKKPEEIEEFRKSCVFDMCNVEDPNDVVCRFADILGDDCSINEKIEIKYKDKLRACTKPACTNNMIYKACGTPSQDTCISRSMTNAFKTLSDTQVCQEGCFCPDGLILDDDKCVKPDDCGCFFHNNYFSKNAEITLPDCSQRVICLGNNLTSVNSVQCNENEECRNEDGVTGCYCKEGFVMMEGHDKCQPDVCFGVVCEDINMKCVNGTCVCKDGLQGDCLKCYDIDECATGLHNCTMVGQACKNTFGSFKCACQKGFIASGSHCKDIDECSFDDTSCGEHSECVNTPGSFHCECCAGYEKDSNGVCVRDTTTATAPNGKCCACQGDKCVEPGKVCGTDGNTYSNYRSLFISNCKAGGDQLKVDYNGACQGTCATVICDKQYSNCSMVNSKPRCSCPTCEDIMNSYEDQTVCATNKITYTSVCHMKKATCEAEIETKVEVEFTGIPCFGKGGPIAGPWSDWGHCSEECKQGTRNRTREVYVTNDENTNVHSTEYIPCYNTCPNGPCRIDTCEGPGEVCVADDHNNPSCQCPACELFEDKPVCGRVREVIQTYENECELEKKICEQKTKDYELLEPRACEDKPVNCSVIRNYRVETDSNGCKADRSINFGACYGGCDNEAELCCFANEKSQASAIVYCPDGTHFEKSFEIIVGCSCVSKQEVQQGSVENHVDS